MQESEKLGLAQTANLFFYRPLRHCRRQELPSTTRPRRPGLNGKLDVAPWRHGPPRPFSQKSIDGGLLCLDEHRIVERGDDRGVRVASHQPDISHRSTARRRIMKDVAAHVP